VNSSPASLAAFVSSVVVFESLCVSVVVSSVVICCWIARLLASDARENE